MGRIKQLLDDMYLENIMFITKEEIKKWLDLMQIQNYTINKDLTVDVDGDVHLFQGDFLGIPLIGLPIQFGVVRGFFDVCNNKLKTLKGAPKKVFGNFHCNNNQLTSLKYAPKIVGKNFSCSNNQLTSLGIARNQSLDEIRNLNH